MDQLFMGVVLLNQLQVQAAEQHHRRHLIKPSLHQSSPLLKRATTGNLMISSTHNEGSYTNHKCYSCASEVYRTYWTQLMHHYYPPKNFTDNCWSPNHLIGTTPCRSACFTMIEDTDEESSPQAIIRGCVDRLLLFGMDEDVKDAIITYHKTCRWTDRHLLQLISLTRNSQNVLMCTCSGEICNGGDMRTRTDSNSSSVLFQFNLIIIIVPLILLNVIWM